jgi:hypothetical protein
MCRYYIQINIFKIYRLGESIDLVLNNNNANIGDESYGSIFSSHDCPNSLGSDLMA